MSSYLERLATNARTPSTRIAPLVRPLYLASPLDPEPAGSSLERRDHDAPAQSPRGTDDLTKARQSPRVTPDAYPSLRSPATPVFRPLLPERRPPEVVAPAFGETPGPRRTSGSATSSSPVATDLRRDRPRHLPEGTTTSLVPRALSVQTPPRTVDTPPRTPHARPRALGANRPERRAADEIRIHIGRVEVVALAPPQPAAPPRERRALRLDDYLRSGR